jgi:hypothetical protein
MLVMTRPYRFQEHGTVPPGVNQTTITTMITQSCQYGLRNRLREILFIAQVVSVIMLNLREAHLFRLPTSSRSYPRRRAMPPVPFGGANLKSFFSSSLRCTIFFSLHFEPLIANNPWTERSDVERTEQERPTAARYF